MEIQYYGANCLTISYMKTRIVIDDNLEDFNKKGITKDLDIILSTQKLKKDFSLQLSIDGPGEYEIGDLTVVGIESSSFTNNQEMTTMYKLSNSEISVLVTGKIYGELNEKQKELIGNIDVMIVPMGNNGLTLDPIQGLKLIKDLEPGIIIPTHFKSDKIIYPVEQVSINEIIDQLGMEIKESTPKLKIKRQDLSENTKLVVLEEL